MRPEVLGGVLGGRCVDAGCAVLFGDLGELIRDDELLRGSHGVVEGLFQRGELRGVLTDALAELGVVGGIGCLDFVERELLGGVVGGADLGGSFEGNVLEHVREAALAGGVVDRAGVDLGEEAEDWRFVALAEHEREAVGQHLDGGATGEVLFEVSLRLMVWRVMGWRLRRLREGVKRETENRCKCDCGRGKAERGDGHAGGGLLRSMIAVRPARLCGAAASKPCGG